MKMEDEKVNAVKEVEMKSQMREDFYKNQAAEFSIKEAMNAKGDETDMFL